MPPLPEYRARELVKNIEVVRVPDLGEGLRQFASGVGALAGAVGKIGRTGATPAAAGSVQPLFRTPSELDEPATENDAAPVPFAGGLAQRRILGDSPNPDPAFEHRARSFYLDTFERSTNSRAEDFGNQYADDPAAFPPVWREHAKGALAEAPEPWRDSMAGVLDRVGRATFSDLLGRKQAGDDARAREAWQQGLAPKLSRLSALSYADDIGGEDYRENAVALEDHLRRGVDAGIIDPQTADQYRHRAADDAAAEALARAAFADARREDADDPATFERHLNARLDDPETSVPADRRRVIGSLARAAHQRLVADRRLALAGLSDEADAIDARLHQGDARDAARLRALASAAERLGEAALADDLTRRADAWPELQAFARLPLSAQAEIVDAADGGDDRTAALARLHAAKSQALGRDAWAYGIEAHGDRLGPVAALDFTKPDALADALKARVPQADRITAYEGMAVVPLSRDELGRFADAIDAGDAGQNTTLLAAVHDGLGEKHIAAVFQKLSEYGSKAATVAAAGALYGDDPKLARDVLKGDELRRDNPKLIPEGDNESAVAERLFGFDALTSNARDRIIDATLALYAKESAERGDDSGALNERRLDAVLQRAADGRTAVDGETTAPHAVSAGTDSSETDLLKRMLAPLADARPDLAGPIADILAAGPDDLKRLTKKFGGRLGDILGFIEAIRSLWKAVNPDKVPAPTDERKSEESGVQEEQESEIAPEAKTSEPAAPAAESPAPTPRQAIAQGEDRYVKIGDKEYVRFENGSYDFGQVTGDIATAAREAGHINFKSGTIRLEKGWHDFATDRGMGEAHIDARHRDEIRSYKEHGEKIYKDAAELVADVAANYNRIARGHNGRLILGKANGQEKVVIIEIEPSGDGYTVITGGLRRPGWLDNPRRALPWRKAGPPSSQDPFAPGVQGSKE